MQVSTKQHWSSVLSSLLILLFVYAAISKLLVSSSFFQTLKAYPLLSSLPGVVVYVVPIAELVTVFLLLVSKTRAIGYWCSLLLLSLFTLYIIYLLLGAAKLPCSCGGVLSQLSWPEHIVFNLLFLVVSIGGIYMERRPASHPKDSSYLSTDPNYLFE